MPNQVGECIICGRISQEGLRVMGKFICSACEKRIANSKISDADYDKLRERLKELWRCSED